MSDPRAADSMVSSASVAGEAETADALRERVRQSERTVDNLKRLYAVLFSISFGVVAFGAVEKLKAYLDPGAI